MPLQTQQNRNPLPVWAWFIVVIGGIVLFIYLVNAVTAENAPMLSALCITLAALLVYFAPAAVARKKRSFGSVMAINFFLGWTIIGWVVALAWALKDDPEPQVILQQPAPAAGPSAPPILCRACGRYSEPGSRFCASCGASMVQERSLKVV